MRLQHLMTLLTVAEHGSISRAAEALNIAQSAVSRTVRELEASVGLPLLERQPWGVSLTPAGGALVARARTIRAEAAAAQRELAAMASAAATHIAIGAGPTAAAFVLPRALNALALGREGLRFEIVEGQYRLLLPQLSRGEIDVIIGPIDIELPSGLVAELLYEDEIVLVARAGHPLTRGLADAADLASAAWVLPPKRSELWRQLDSVFRVQGLDIPLASIETESIGLTRASLLLGDAITAVPRHLVQLDLDGGRLQVIESASGGWRRPIGAIHPEGLAIRRQLRPLLRAVQAAASA